MSFLRFEREDSIDVDGTVDLESDEGDDQVVAIENEFSTLVDDVLSEAGLSHVVEEHSITGCLYEDGAVDVYVYAHVEYGQEDAAIKAFEGTGVEVTVVRDGPKA